jgi:signal transduction histidine kinase
LHGRKSVVEAMTGFLKNAQKRMDICAGVIAGQEDPEDEMSRAYFALVKRGTHLRVIGEITRGRVDRVKAIANTIEIRHLPGVTSYFGVSDAEYVALPSKGEFNPVGPLLYSNEEPFVKHHQALFDMLWDRAVPADVRIDELERGESAGETRITFSTQDIMDSARTFADGMKEEALILTSREGSIRDNLELFRRIAKRASETEAKVRILGRFQNDEQELIGKFQAQGLQFRALSPGRVTNLALGIYDRKGMGLVEYRYPGMQRLEGQTYLTGVISTIFDSLWEESELRQKAELMRDIVTHDMGNYNQIFMSNAEVLKEGLGNNRLGSNVDAILRAIDGAKELIEKTEVLVNIVGDKGLSLHPVDLLESVERSGTLVKKANPAKSLQLTRVAPRSAMVLADSLLDQVFVNILSNAYRYTDGRQVRLELKITPEEVGGKGSRKKHSYWKVEISDHGRGMTDDLKSSAAFRYAGAQTGRGLGLSIVRALAVDRYSGRLELRDRVEGDYTKGTRVEVWLLRP